MTREDVRTALIVVAFVATLLVATWVAPVH